MKMLFAMLLLALGVPAFACPPAQLYMPQADPVYAAPMYMPMGYAQQSYSTGFARYNVPYATPQVFLQQPPSFSIVNVNNNNNNGGGPVAARASRAASMGAFVPSAGTQVNFIGRRAFRLGRGVTINP